MNHPYLLVDTDVVEARAREFVSLFPGAHVRYAVKANPEPAVLDAVLSVGAGFDVAGRAEIELCLARGADPATLAYGNTIKKRDDIAFAYAHGVREFTSDALSDIENLAEYAPGSLVSIRLLLDAPDSVTPFGRKFGCEPEAALDLARRAVALGLRVGLAFHVGSQQPDPRAWEIGIATAAKLAAEGLFLERVNIGGGFPVSYRDSVPPLAEYASAIASALAAYFPDGHPPLLLEPGRVLVADAGVIRTEVVLVKPGSPRWVYLDIGRYNGLAETENEAIAYRLLTERDGPSGPVILAGPTCDGDDVLYQRTPYELPLSLRAGDLVEIPGAGAYTASYASVAFNGIEPLAVRCVGRFAHA
ncbi:ornithine decarboxylase [Amycolatopsis xylanica]|uniref:ornithine decarboxylase n=1 Tax=Amycolatopsis xylanica TaxID=589385 RepID=A0A1H3P5V5_9PSEU|nr:type III PLP-dependent enzyme [Amycolatopsis xylanica]SDY96492.1 ornithine decarboxylase [Amycolatopsis xylanica]